MKRLVSALFVLVVLALIVPPTSSQPVTAQTDPDYWPTDGWRSTTPEEQGMLSARLADAVSLLITQDDYNIHNLLVVRHGYVVLDVSFYPYPPDSLHDLASVTKSVTATIVAAAIQQGYLEGVAQPVSDFFPGVDASMTIEDPLTMRSGLTCIHEPTEMTLLDMLGSPDWLAFTLAMPQSAPPGTLWDYCSPTTHLLTALVGQSTGMNTLDFARAALFDPLGVGEVLWPPDPQGIPRGWGDLHMTPRDMARIGYLYLQDGLWDGERLLPEGWVEAATSPAAEDVNYYGYLWWLEPNGVVSARGRGGQLIYLIPEDDMVVVITANGGTDMGAVLTPLFQNYLTAAAVSDEPLDPNPDAVARLEGLVAQAARAPEMMPVSSTLPSTAAAISDRVYVLDRNVMGLDTVSLAFSTPDEAMLHISTTTFITGEDAWQWTIGLDGVPRFAPGRLGLPAAGVGAWQGEMVFRAEIDEIGNNFMWGVEAIFYGDRVTLTMTEHGGWFPEPIQIVGRVSE